MDGKVESIYRQIFSDVVDEQETQDLHDFFISLNLPPDKLVGFRAAAFRVACEFLTDRNDANGKLLQSIKAIVDALEHAYME